MQRVFTSLTLTVALLTTQQTLLNLWGGIEPVYAQTQQDDLYYTFYNQRIPLTQRSDRIAVVFTQPDSTSGTREIGASTEPGFVRLQQDLLGQPGSSGTRSGNLTGRDPKPALSVDVQPLGSRYALIQLPDDANAALRDAVQDRLQQPYIESTLPVLSRADSEDPDDTIVLPNEILLSFEPGTSQSKVLLTLSRYRLEMVRPLRFSEDRYLVRSQGEPGLEVLAIANRLNGASGVQAATPNFVQTFTYDGSPQDGLSPQLARSGTSTASLETILANLPAANDSPYSSSLFPLLWHLDSTPVRGQLQPRTDIRATEAWELGSEGDGVVVAVIDSLIQWDHPDLRQNIAKIAPDDPNRLPGEISGWDFSNRDEVVCANDDRGTCVVGDPDTRIEDEELEIVTPHFQNSFTLSDAEFAETYSSLVRRIERYLSDLSESEVLRFARGYIQRDIAAEFHGTWSAGVIAARPAEDIGAVGVAPQAKILPVRVFGLGGEITSAALVEAIGYAAERDVDIINMSLGGLLPDRALIDQLFAVQDAHPDLVIVASAGNSSLDGVAFPAATPGTISVGATSLHGTRTRYSTYGAGLDVVAPGGETSLTSHQGILTTGGTGIPAFWSELSPPDHRWGMALDPLGAYVQVQGTSFSAPAVSGVLALMKGEDEQRRLNREQFMALLEQTASYEGLQISKADTNHYRLQASVGFGTARDFAFLRPTGIFPIEDPISAEAYFFGRGLVDARAAVEAVREAL